MYIHACIMQVLNTLDVQDRLAQALRLLKIELEQAEIQRSIQKQMEDSVTKMQRKHYLTEQLKIIKKELGLEKVDLHTYNSYTIAPYTAYSCICT